MCHECSTINIHTLLKSGTLVQWIFFIEYLNMCNASIKFALEKK